MRPLLFTLANTIFLLIGISFYSQCQIAKSNTDSKEPDGKFKHNKLFRNEVNSAALRDFMKRYTAVSNEKWTVTDAGITASFVTGEISHSVCYDQKGNWVFTIRRFSEKYLPKNTRKLIRRSYSGYNIRGVEETEKSFNLISYLLLLESETEWIKLREKDGELIELEKISKVQ
jgi:hypothetical protein